MCHRYYCDDSAYFLECSKLNNRNLPNEWSGDLNWVSTRSKQTITNFVHYKGKQSEWYFKYPLRMINVYPENKLH